MDDARILYVRGIGSWISKEELTIYFQSRKQSGGGDVRSIDLKEDEAIITFEDGDGKLFFTSVLSFFCYSLSFTHRITFSILFIEFI